jgi:sugar O-acyltransferase (sialic acid O-acetyltransferase NeuD family)
MKRVVSVGAGGFGREMLSWLKELEESDQYELTGFLDKNIRALENYDIDYPILGDPENYEPKNDELFVCAIGNPGVKLQICSILKSKGGEFLKFVHPTAFIGRGSSIGDGTVLCPGAVVTSNAVIGSFVTLNVHASIGHDAVVGDGCTISGHCDVTGFASLGKGVFMGTHAAVLPKAVVGDYATIGAGSVVLKKVRSNATVFGVPAKQISRIEKKQ